MNATVNTCMKNAISSFQKVIKNVDQWLFLVSSVVHEKICREKDNIPWNMTKDSIPVFLIGQFNINATTKYSHTERDSSYTIIHVPSQEKKSTPTHQKDESQQDQSKRQIGKAKSKRIIKP